MPGIDELIPNATQIRKEAALKEAEKAEEYVRAAAAAETEKRALIERLSKPSGKTEEEKIKLAATIIQRAVRNGLTEVQVYRFPNTLCTDKGRAINQMETGWENTLTGIPKEIFQLWTDHLKPRGYRIGYQIIDFPGWRARRHRRDHLLGRLNSTGARRSERRSMAKDDPAAQMKRKDYEKELEKLQIELCQLQDYVRENKLRVIVLFEGRDAAGKGGTIKAITEKVSPRVFRVVALPAPSDREKTQLFFQRYMEQFPAGGEIVIFDRSWYNRAGVEYVMGFCTPAEHARFLALCPQMEKYAIDGGIILVKIWLEVGMEEQERRFKARIDDPVRQWKLSPMDLESFKRWYAYSRARDLMLMKTSTKYAPWYIIRSDDKRRARLNCIAHLLKAIPHKRVRKDKVRLPRRSDKGRYNDQATLRGMNFVTERF